MLASSKDGVYLLRSDSDRKDWHVTGPTLVRHDVCHIVRDHRGVLWAAANPHDGKPAIYRSEDEGETWIRCGELSESEPAWHVPPGRKGENGRVWAGIMPATPSTKWVS